jgi:3-methyladenine DNA glycosylase AlkD
LKEFVRLCFEDDHREVHYIALQMVGKTLKKQDESFIEFLEELILKQSWWDSVDWISKFVSLHFQRFPKNIKPITGRWIESDNIWLQRMAIIFQRYKKYPTDWALLQKYILRRANSSEFFVQKAAGWALRDHSKIDAAAVVGFVEAHPELSNLTQREALKWLKERGLF